MNPRKEELLSLIIENYTRTAEPIGSKFLAENTDLGLSGATLRNEMRDLEEEGYLTHPHTSAGRIPTEFGFRYYVEKIMKTTAPTKKVKKAILEKKGSHEQSTKQIKAIAKFIAEQGGCAVIIALNKDTIYYTGISNLFSQPEFRDFSHTMSVSAMFDQCEDRINDLYESSHSKGTSILLGNKNPLGQACGAVLVRFGENSLFTILGPMRMDYGRTVGILEFVKTII